MPSKYQLFKLYQNYHKSPSKDMRCGTCRHLKTYHYHGKYYHKCKLIGESSSAATDIRLSYVCNMWNKDLKDLPIFGGSNVVKN